MKIQPGGWTSGVFLLNLLLSITRYSTQAPISTNSSTCDWWTEEWDAIVVGAGPAGIIVADRLSEAGKRTLLLEQGGKSYGIVGGTQRPGWLTGTNLSRVDVPGLYKSVFADDGNLTCTGRANAYGGCTIGGGSAINAGLFFQPPASDWDNFHPAGWKSADVHNATQRLYSRQASVVTTSQNSQYYLQSGYEAAKTWLVNGAGFADVSINDKADRKFNVFGRPAYDYANGQRGGPVTTYLQSAISRPNFHLQDNVQVLHVSRSGNISTGVHALVNNSIKVTVKLSPGGHVILSAGAIQSPQLLMLSGIGDPETLAKLQQAGKLSPITPNDWLNNTAIGAGLFDNPNTFIELEGPTIDSYSYSYDSPAPSDRDLYLNSRSGPYSFASQTSVFWSYINHTDGSPPAGMQGTIDSSGFGAYTSNKTITLNVYGTSGLLSRGRVVLDEKADFLPGISNDVYFSDPTSRDATDIAQFIHNIFSHLSSSSSTATPILTPLNIPLNSTVEQIKTYITTPSAYARGQVSHWSSSCALGGTTPKTEVKTKTNQSTIEDDGEYCVESATTKVKGMRNLHVVDGSIVEPLTVNPQFGIMVAAERGSEVILKSW